MESAFKTTEMDDFIEERQRELYHHGLNTMHKFGNDELEQLDLSWTNKSVKVDENGSMMSTSPTTMTSKSTVTATNELINDDESNLEFSNNFDLNFKQQQQLTSDDDNNFNHLLHQQTTTKTIENYENNSEIIIDNNGSDLVNKIDYENQEFHHYQQHFDHQQNEENSLDNDCEQQQPQQQLSFGATIANNADNDFGPETCVDVTDDVIMMTENSADTNLQEHSTLSHSKDDTLPSSTADNCNPLDIRNIMAVELDANKATPLLSPEVEDLPLSEASASGIGESKNHDENDVQENFNESRYDNFDDKEKINLSIINDNDFIAVKKLDEPLNYDQSNHFNQSNGHLSPEMETMETTMNVDTLKMGKIEEQEQNEKEDEIMGCSGDFEEEEEEEEEEDGGKSTAELSISDNANDRDDDENVEMEFLSGNVKNEKITSNLLQQNHDISDLDHVAANLLEETKPILNDIVENLIENVKEPSNDSRFIQENDNMMHYNQNGEVMQLSAEANDDHNQRESFNSVTVLKECHEFKEELEAVNEQIRSMGNHDGDDGHVEAAVDEVDVDIDDMSDDNNIRLKEEEEILEKHHIEEIHDATTTRVSSIRMGSPDEEQNEFNGNSTDFLPDEPKTHISDEMKLDELTESKIVSDFEFLHSENEREGVIGMETYEEEHTEQQLEQKSQDINENQFKSDDDEQDEKENVNEMKCNEILKPQQEYECVEDGLEDELLQTQDETISNQQYEEIEQQIFESNEFQQKKESIFEQTSIGNDFADEELPVEATTEPEKEAVDMDCTKSVIDDDVLDVKTISNENIFSNQQNDQEAADEDHNRQQQLEYQRSTGIDFVANNDTLAATGGGSPQSEEEEWKYIKEVQSEKQGLEKPPSTSIIREEENEDDEILNPSAVATATTNNVTEQISPIAQQQQQQIATFDADAATDAAEADMNSKLNPEAKEFVPSSHSPLISPNIEHLNHSFTIDQQQHRSSPAHLSNGGDAAATDLIISPNAATAASATAAAAARQHRILIDDVVAQSPKKGLESNMENILIPDENDFTDDISKRPHSDIVDLLNNSIDNDLVAGGGDFYQEMNLKNIEKDQNPASVVVTNNNHQHQLSSNLLDNADMKESIYIENSGTAVGAVETTTATVGNEVEDLLNTVQPLPTDSESNNSFEIENIYDVGSQTTSKEDLFVNFQEKDMVSPSTDEMNEIVTLVAQATPDTNVIQNKMEKMLLDHDQQLTEGLVKEEKQQQQPINGVEMAPSKGGDTAAVAVAIAAGVGTTAIAAAKTIEAAKNAKNLTKSAAAAATTANNTKSKVPPADAKKSSSSPSTITTTAATAATNKTTSGSMANKRPISSTTSKVGTSSSAKNATAATAAPKPPRTAAAATAAAPPTAAAAASKSNAALTEKKPISAPMISNVKPRIDTKPPATLVAKKLQNTLASAKPAVGGKNAVSAKSSVTSRATLASVSTTSTAKMAARATASATNNNNTANATANGGSTAAKSTANLTASSANAGKVVTKNSLTSPRGTHASALRKSEALKSPTTKPTSATTSTSRVSNGQSTKTANTTRTSATNSNATKTTTSSRTTSAATNSTSATGARRTTSAGTHSSTLAPKTNTTAAAAGGGGKKLTPVKKPTAGSAHATPIGRKNISGVKPNSAGNSPVSAVSKTSSNNKTKDAPSSSAEDKNAGVGVSAENGGPKMNGSSSPQIDIATEAFEQVTTPPPAATAAAATSDAQQLIPMEIA